MDFNLNNEYDQLSQYFKKGLSSLSSFASFIKVIHKQSEQSALVTKKALDSLINEVLKEDNQTSVAIYFAQFYTSFNQYLKQLQFYNNKIANELIEPLNQFISHLSSKQSEAIASFKEIITSALGQKRKYELSKSNYFSACKASQDQEKLVIQSLDNKEKQLGTDKEVEQSHDVLYKMRSVAEDNYLKYKNEHKITNALYEENNTKYFPCIEKIKDLEESREAFIKFHFEKMNQLFKANSSIFNNLINQITDNITEIKPEEDMKLFKEKTKYSLNDQERFIPEEMINYDIYRRNIEALITKNSLLLQQEKGIESGASQDSFIGKVNNPNFNYLFLKEEKDILDSFFTNSNDINGESPIFIELNKKLETNHNIARNFIDYLLDNYYSKEKMINIRNESNYSLLASLLSSAILNPVLQSNIFEINFAIIYIAQKTFIENKDNQFEKLYMCNSLSCKIDQYHSKLFWERLLNIKIETTITSKAKNHLVKLLKQEKETNASVNLSQSQPQSMSSMLNMVFNIGKTLYNTTKSNQDTKYHQEVLDKIIERIKTEEAFNCTKDFIPHFSEFNLDPLDITDIISQISLQYKFSNEINKIKYLLAIVNSNMYSVKKATINKHKSNALDYILTIGKSTNAVNNNSFMNKNYFQKKNIKDAKLRILLNSMKYLKGKDHINFLCLNKSYSKTISEVFYRNVITKTKSQLVPVSVHIKIWKQLLHCSTIISKQSYSALIEEMSANRKEIFSLIKLDAERTSFPNNDNSENNKEMLYTILCVLVLDNPSINYSQGMNYIAAFLLHYTQNEEEAYNIFNSLLKKTEYSDLFTNELHRMKKYFYVFDRLIFIYMPELFTYLKSHAVSVAYYISPWFITLFTNAFQYIGHNQTPKVFVWIIDLFILNGWKAIIKLGLCLMKNFEAKLLNLKYEELLHFLVNDMLKYDFFQAINYDRLQRSYSLLKIESGLITNLENEYEIKFNLDKLNLDNQK